MNAFLFSSSSFDGHGEDGDVPDEATSDVTAKANGSDGSQKDVKVVSHQIPPWLSYATPDEFLVRSQ